MLHQQQPQKTHIYFIGIGGSGMSGIAEVLHNLGYIISGSDIKQNKATKHLASLGCKIYTQHRKSQLKQVQIVVISSAISVHNEELLGAKEYHIPIVGRAEMLAELMRFRYGIAIAGTHGKTTTTSLVAYILAQSGLSPTYIIGGVLNNSGTNAKLGGSDFLVVEADESDSSFLHLQPQLAVVTNIDSDHMSTYDYELAKLDDAFLNFITNLPFDGLCIACLDDVGIRRIAPKINRPLLSYGFHPSSDIIASEFEQSEQQMSYRVNVAKYNLDFRICAQLIGEHNVQNTLAAIGVGLSLNIGADVIIKALKTFGGVSRRLSYHRLMMAKKPITYFDDYAHHPNEIKAVIAGLRKSYKKRLVLVFQPHRYSRTQELFADFVAELSKVDVLILLDIYPAGESAIADVNSTALARSICSANVVPYPNVFSSQNELLDHLLLVLKSGDLLLSCGAGNIDQLAKILITNYGI